MKPCEDDDFLSKRGILTKAFRIPPPGLRQARSGTPKIAENLINPCEIDGSWSRRALGIGDSSWKGVLEKNSAVVLEGVYKKNSAVHVTGEGVYKKKLGA